MLINFDVELDHYCVGFFLNADLHQRSTKWQFTNRVLSSSLATSNIVGINFWVWCKAGYQGAFPGKWQGQRVEIMYLSGR